MTPLYEAFDDLAASRNEDGWYTPQPRPADDKLTARKAWSEPEDFDGIRAFIGARNGLGIMAIVGTVAWGAYALLRTFL